MPRRLSAWAGVLSVICPRGLTGAATLFFYAHQSLRSLQACRFRWRFSKLHALCKLATSFGTPQPVHSYRALRTADEMSFVTCELWRMATMAASPAIFFTLRRLTPTRYTASKLTGIMMERASCLVLCLLAICNKCRMAAALGFLPWGFCYGAPWLVLWRLGRTIGSLFAKAAFGGTCAAEAARGGRATLVSRAASI